MFDLYVLFNIAKSKTLIRWIVGLTLAQPITMRFLSFNKQ